MSQSRLSAHERLSQTLDQIGSMLVAVSGGIDSLTLMSVAHSIAPWRVRGVHAVSPAVPREATERLRLCADRYGWTVEEVDAGEFSDSSYLSNPVNRCFFCKSRLYSTLKALSKKYGTIVVSGTNIDDIADYRPGLAAAENHGVRHPFVEAGINKVAIRSLANFVGLGELSDIPASPCLSSRIETGIAIEPKALRVVDDIEIELRNLLKEPVVRCRLRAASCEIELGPTGLAYMTPARRNELGERLKLLLSQAGCPRAKITFSPYRMGSAFLGAA